MIDRMTKPSDAELHLLRAILQTAVDVVIAIDIRGTMVLVNPASERMFQYTVAELLGNNVSMLMPEAFACEHDDYLRSYLETGNQKIIGIGREVVGRRKDGSVFPVHLAVSEVRLPNYHLFVGIVRDISELKQAEAELAQLNQELEQRVARRTAQLEQAQATLIQREKLATLGEIAGGMAHEVRNPLNALKTSAYYLQHAPNLTDEKAREHLERISRQVSLIDSVVTALTDVARLPDPHLRRTSIQHAVHECLAQTDIPQSVQVLVELPAELPCVLADENQIPIALRNLIQNAIESMNGIGGTLRIAADLLKTSPPMVAVSISDTGRGIPAALLNRITEPLYSTKPNGMGLGLTITRAIVHKNGGELQIASELGCGSTFTFQLPAT